MDLSKYDLVEDSGDEDGDLSKYDITSDTGSESKKTGGSVYSHYDIIRQVEWMWNNTILGSILHFAVFLLHYTGVFSHKRMSHQDRSPPLPLTANTPHQAGHRNPERDITPRDHNLAGLEVDRGQGVVLVPSLQTEGRDPGTPVPEVAQGLLEGGSHGPPDRDHDQDQGHAQGTEGKGHILEAGVGEGAEVNPMIGGGLAREAETAGLPHVASLSQEGEGDSPIPVPEAGLVTKAGGLAPMTDQKTGGGVTVPELVLKTVIVIVKICRSG